MRSSYLQKTVIPKGTTLLKSKPFAYCVKSNFRSQLCDYCLKPNPNLRRCTGCFVVSYCGRSCQRDGWIDHKQECCNLARVKPKIPPDAVRLIARIICRLQRGGDIESEQICEGRSRHFKDLMSHYKELKQDTKRMEHFMTIYEVLKEYLSGVVLPNTAELLGIYGRVCVNSFNIVNGEMQAIGTGIYLAPSIIDHSCSPNAVVTFDGFELRVQAMQEFASLNWDAIRICYIDLMNCNNDRMKELKERYYFDCDCPRCHNNDIDKYHYAAKCQDCGSALTAKKRERPEDCSYCGYRLDQSRVKQFWDAIEFSEEQLALMQEMNYLDICKLCLNKQSDILHDLCLVRCKMLDAAFDSAIQLELWSTAYEYGIPLLPAYKLWYGKEHPLTAILLVKLFKISKLVDSVDQQKALAYYFEAVSILEMTHGKTSSFLCQEVKPLL